LVQRPSWPEKGLQKGSAKGRQCRMKSSRTRRRERFLAAMSKDAMRAYEYPYSDWDEDEKEYMPQFPSLVGRGKRIERCFRAGGLETLKSIGPRRERILCSWCSEPSRTGRASTQLEGSLKVEEAKESGERADDPRPTSDCTTPPPCYRYTSRA